MDESVLERTRGDEARGWEGDSESESGKGRREEKNAPAPSNSTGKKRKQEDVAAVAPMTNETKVHHHADEDEYSD